jgi:hypothetical protein
MYEHHIEMMHNRLKIESEAYKLKVKELKDMLRSNDLSELERNVVRLILKDSTKTFQKTKKRTAAELREEMEDHTDAIKLLQDRKKEVFKNVKKTMKNMVKMEKKKENESLKEATKLRKTLRKQGELQEEIKDEGIKVLVNKYEGTIKNELDEMLEKEIVKQKDFEKKEEEKRRQQEEKKREKEEKKREKEEKKRLQEEKKREREEKKQHNKTRKNKK